MHSDHFYSASSTQKRSQHSTDTVPKFHAEAPQATVSEGLDQGSYVAERAGVEPTTLRLKATDSTNVSPRPTILYMYMLLLQLRPLSRLLFQIFNIVTV